jgi:hypothetical protein
VAKRKAFFRSHKSHLSADSIHRFHHDSDKMADETEEAPLGDQVTVRFYVGGKLYKVSRSVIEQQHDTMLAQLVSETWQNEDSRNKAIFIDRDRERFAFVLDYLCCGQVRLPATMSKDAPMKDMDSCDILAEGSKIVRNYGALRGSKNSTRNSIA